MRALRIMLFCLVDGCAYTQPILVTNAVTGLNRLKAISANLKPEISAIAIKYSNGRVIEIAPLDKRVPWQNLVYQVADIQKLIAKNFADFHKDNSICTARVEILTLSHKAEAVGLNYDVVYMEGRFHVTNTCQALLSCDVQAEYKTDDYFVTPSSDNSRYSEAIIGVLLNAAVAAQNCNTERNDND